MDINARLDYEAERDRLVLWYQPDRVKQDITAALRELHQHDPIQEQTPRGARRVPRGGK